MVSGTRAAREIEITAEGLQADLARLKVQKQALERELAAVVAHLGSVQRALGALESVMLTPDSPAEDRATASGKGTQRVTGTDTDAHTDAQTKYGRLTQQIMEYFASVGGIEVRARDVAAALGRDADSGSINAVRSTLDRLVGASRVQRVGRGLYCAK